MFLPDGTYTLREYDNFGRVTAEIDQLANRKDLAYDSSGRLAQVQLPAVPNPLNANVATRPTYLYEYNSFGQMSKLTDPYNHITNFAFNAICQSASRSLPLGQVETYSYDSRQRMTLQVSFESIHKRTVYDDSATGGGRVLRYELFANATDYSNFTTNTPGSLGPTIKWERVSMTYDAFGRMLTTSHIYASGATSGAPTTVLNTDTWTNNYDVQGRLTQETSPTGSIYYEYDNIGRKTQSRTVVPTVPGVASEIRYTYDSLGRLATVSTVKRDGAYVDSNGPTDGTPPESSTYHFDLLDRMDYTELPNSVVEDYTFDNMDRLDVMRHYASDANNAVLTDNVLKDIFDHSYRNQCHSCLSPVVPPSS